MTNLKAPTLIDVVARHEQEIQELKRLLTPISMTYESGYESGYKAGMDENEKREWVGLTDEEKQNAYLKIDSWDDCVNFIEAKLKQKNGGDFAIDTELKRLGYPL